MKINVNEVSLASVVMIVLLSTFVAYISMENTVIGILSANMIGFTAYYFGRLSKELDILNDENLEHECKMKCIDSSYEESDDTW